jgi:hypothetical protein
MAISVSASGAQTAVIGTEHTLTTNAVGGTFVLALGASPLVNGDTLELRIKTRVTSGGSPHTAYFAIYSNAQGEGAKYSIPIPVPSSTAACATLKQTAGTGRAFDWMWLQIDATS